MGLSSMLKPIPLASRAKPLNDEEQAVFFYILVDVLILNIDAGVLVDDIFERFVILTRSFGDLVDDELDEAFFLSM